MKKLFVLLILLIGTVCYAVEPLTDEVIKQSDTTMLLKYMVKQEKTVETQSDFEQFYQNLNKVIKVANERNDWKVHADKQMNYTLEPNSELFGFCPNETTGIWINHDYLKKHTSKLDKVWKDYFKLYKTLPDFYVFGDSVTTAKSLIALQKFQKKYPAFYPILIENKIEEEFYWLTDNFYAFYSGSLSDTNKEGYLYYLTFGNSSTKEYQTVQECYDALKKNSFKPNYNFYLSLYNYYKNDYYRNMLYR